MKVKEAMHKGVDWVSLALSKVIWSMLAVL
jgi:hypothetical protein